MDCACFLSPLSASLWWWLPSFLWACSDMLDIPLIYGSYIIGSNIIHWATGCLPVSLTMVITQLQGWIKDWKKGLDGWYAVARWIDKALLKAMSELYGCRGHSLLQMMYIHGLVRCVLQIISACELCECKTGKSVGCYVSLFMCGQHIQAKETQKGDLCVCVCVWSREGSKGWDGSIGCKQQHDFLIFSCIVFCLHYRCGKCRICSVSKKYDRKNLGGKG